VNWIEVGRFLIIAGTVIVVVGVVFLLADKLPIGRLPGDLRFGNERVRIYIPVATCILLSIIITLIVNFFAKK
jgi:hypothetical protein